MQVYKNTVRNIKSRISPGRLSSSIVRIHEFPSYPLFRILSGHLQHQEYTATYLFIQEHTGFRPILQYRPPVKELAQRSRAPPTDPVFLYSGSTSGPNLFGQRVECSGESSLHACMSTSHVPMFVIILFLSHFLRHSNFRNLPSFKFIFSSFSNRSIVPRGQSCVSTDSSFLGYFSLHQDHFT
jgi:hypothetical protein